MVMDVIKFIGATRQAACVVYAGADPLLFHGCNYWLGRDTSAECIPPIFVFLFHVSFDQFHVC